MDEYKGYIALIPRDQARQYVTNQHVHDWASGMLDVFVSAHWNDQALTLPSIGGRTQIQFYGITYHAYQLNVLGWGPDRDLLMLVREYASAALGPSGGFAIDRQPFGDLPVFKLTMEPIDEQIKRLAQQWANKEI